MTKKARSRKGKRIRNILLCFFALTALLFLFLWNMRIDTVSVEGSEFYTEDEIVDFVFTTQTERNFLYAWLNDRFGEKKSIPFVAGYTLEFIGVHEVKITVYEKSVVGYIEYMGSNMYFDQDGTIVESSTEQREGVPLITGLDFDYIVLYKPLPVEDDTTFTQILNLTQLIARYQIDVDRIYFDSRMNATLYIGGVRVLLGNNQNMEYKIAELSGMLPQLKGLSGVLHLENYDRTAINPSYSFIQDETEETAAEETAAEAGESEGAQETAPEDGGEN